MTSNRAPCHLAAGNVRTANVAPQRGSVRALVLLSALLMLSAECRGAIASAVAGERMQYTHMAWTESPGLKGRVNSIVQTNDGYLWLGTEFGLVRFDGVRFVPSGPGVGPPLPSANILSLLAARDGALWVGTLDGLVSWRNGQLVRYSALASMPVFALLEDHEGTIWAGGTGGLCAIHGAKVQCTEIEGRSGRGLFYSNGDRSSVVYSLYEDNEHHLWVGTESGLWRWTPAPARRYTSQTVRAAQSLVSGEGGKGLLVIGGGDDRVLMHTTGQGIEEYDIPGVPRMFGAESLLRDRHGALWIGTMQRGLLHVQNGRATWLERSVDLSGDLVTALLEDREGTVWVGTTNGLDQLRQAAVSTITNDRGLSTPVACVLAARDGSLWIGSYGGLNRWKDGRLTIYRATPSPLSQRVPAAEPRSGTGPGKITRLVDRQLLGSAIDSLFEDPQGRIWVGTDHGTSWFENGRFHRVRGVPDTIWIAMFSDGHEGVWASYPGSGLLHIVAGRLVGTVPWPWARRGPDPRLSAVAADPLAGGLWLGFLHGGVAYFKDGQLRTSFGRRQGLESDTVWNLLIDHEGTLWAATEGGLSRIKDGRAQTLTRKNGLPCDSIKWVIEDNAYSLWLNTSCGLLRIEHSEWKAWESESTRSVHPLVLDRTDGLRMHALGAALVPVVSKSIDGKLWFVHLDGVSAIDPLHLQINRVLPPVHIERITADGQRYSASPGLQLPAQLRDLTIEYTALSMVAPEKVRFRFKLEGQDRDWREVLNVRRVEYSNLAPGSYRFRVVASNNSGVWNEQGATLGFTVAPAYWQTAWFRVAFVAGILTGLWALHRRHLRRIARGLKARSEARIAERTRIARELHDTLLQSFQGLLLRLQTAYAIFDTHGSDAKAILGRTIDQAARAIAEGREAVQGLRTSNVEINDLAEAIKIVGEDLAAEAGADAAVGLHVVVEGAARSLHPIVRDEIYRIAGEALRNAFRHAQARHIEVELRYDEQQLRVWIRDDGKGIDPSILSEGRAEHFGLQGMRERARRIRGKLAIWTAADSGTEIELAVPAADAYLDRRPRPAEGATSEDAGGG